MATKNSLYKWYIIKKYCNSLPTNTRIEILTSDNLLDDLKIDQPVTAEDLWARKLATLRSLVPIVAAGDGSSPVEIAEVGSWLGGTVINWAAAISEYNAGVGHIVCIDPWLPYEGGEGPAQIIDEEMNRLLESGEAFDLFKANIRRAGVQDMIEIYRAESDVALKQLVGRQFDLIFIDGNHAYRHVKSDIENALPLIRDGGIICGDDLEVLFAECNNVLAVKWAQMGAEYVFEPATRIWFHPGVTVAVAEIFVEVSRRGAAWAVKKLGDRWSPVEFG